MEGLGELLRRVEAAGLGWEDLFEVVHDLKSREASDINNAGMEAQLEYILEACGGDVEVAAQTIGLED
ncbi:MAG: hypothetical protein ACPLRW_05615 [Moorellales bacterium]